METHGDCPNCQVLRGEISALKQEVHALREQVTQLAKNRTDSQQEINALREEVKRLLEQLAKNSSNSSKPPSSDGLKRPPRTQRRRGERKPGGQPGHTGRTLQMVEKPNHTVVHPVDRCEGCGCGLVDRAPDKVERHQVFDLPPVSMEVTEHQAETKTCPHCGHVNKAAFPEDATTLVQYGIRVKAWAVYLQEYEFIPYDRAAELMKDLFGVPISPGTLANIVAEAGDLAQAPAETIRTMLMQVPVVNFDETGARVEGRRIWEHVASTSTLTFYDIHPKRGKEAMEDIGILPNFRGRAVHDFWAPYLSYDHCAHAFCNDHLLRELTFEEQERHQAWATDMKAVLLDAKAAVEDAQARGLPEVDPIQCDRLEARYGQALAAGWAANPPPELPCDPHKRGRRKETPTRNLLGRFRDYPKQILAFLYDFRVPFGNSQAERDIRMQKVQQKISGTFRSTAGAKAFCRIRSYISTARKNAQNVLGAIEGLFNGVPYVPQASRV